MTETCTRCRQEVDIDSDAFADGEATPDGQYICGGCLTGAEQESIAQDDAALLAAVDAAGLAGDTEAMSEAEYEMREDLAELIYEQDRP